MKRPIDIKRESASEMEVAIPPGTKLGTGFGIGDKLYVLSEKSIHAIQMADNIDPNRVNINLPNVQQLILSYGSADEFIGRVLLTGIALIKDGPLDPAINSEEALRIIFDITVLVSEMHSMRRDYETMLHVTVEGFDRVLPKGNSIELPHYERLTEWVKTFIGKVVDAGQRLFDLYVHFYGKPDRMWSGAKAAVEARFAPDDPFVVFMGQAEPFLRFIREIRDCAQHESASQRIIVTNFEMQPDGNVYTPTIEVIHPKRSAPRIPLDAFLSEFEKSFITACERMIVFLAEKHAASASGGIEFRALELPEDRWRNHVRFAFLPFRKDGTFLGFPG